jgi:hypothetical protein
LVWKDEHGTLGFSNVVYPEAAQVSAYKDDEWIGVEKQTLSQVNLSAREYATPEGQPPEAVASKMSTRYLVWKDEHGNLGFGNVVYPGKQNVSYVHVDGSWEKVMN